MTARKEYTLTIWCIESEEYPVKKSGFRWELRGKHYSCYSENIFNEKCDAFTSAFNFGSKYGFGVKNTYYAARKEFEIRR